MVWINRGGMHKDVGIFNVQESKGTVHYSVQGVLSFMPLFASFEQMAEKFGIDIVTDDQLFEILGIDPDEDEDLRHDHVDVFEIQVCAGSWKRIDAKFWAFERDLEWES